jgi:hypothetical protein
MGGGRNWLRTVSYPSFFFLSCFLLLLSFSSFLAFLFFDSILHYFLPVFIFFSVFLYYLSSPFRSFVWRGPRITLCELVLQTKPETSDSLWREDKLASHVSYSALKPQFLKTNTYLGPRRHLNEAPHWAKCRQDIYHRMFHVTRHPVSGELPHDTEFTFQNSRGMYSVVPLSDKRHSLLRSPNVQQSVAL